MRVPLLAFIGLMLASPLSAQSVYGPGGLFLDPTASLPPLRSLVPSVLVLHEDIRHGSDPAFSGTWISSSIDYGFQDNLELGVALVAESGVAGEGNSSVGGYGKYRLLKEGNIWPALAIGGTLLGFGEANYRLGYIALRKHLYSRGEKGMQFIGDMGVQYADVVDGINKHAVEPFAGLEFIPVENWVVTAEGRPRLNGESGTPAALTVSHRSASGYHIALTYANNGPSRSPRLGFGVGFALGSRR
ncbi:MAG: hypothetical protein M3Y56_05920 [Armatimonadota bacterium]|nr:hypothetical protein [Armatimonadota bacterium]